MKLSELRKSKKITLKRLSEISSISCGYLSDLERGKNEATESKIIRLSLALNVSPNELLGWDTIINNAKQNITR